MTFSVFLPPTYNPIPPSTAVDASQLPYDPARGERGEGRVPAVYWLSGLTCNDQNFITKAGAQQAAARNGLALIVPDTSPRGDEVAKIEGVGKDWDFGLGAGFYVNATEPKYREFFNMYDYITRELPALVNDNFNIDGSRIGISGHSMGGHGALICALKNPGMYRGVSAFAPISNPTKCPWGVKAFTGYLGPEAENLAAWKAYDATELLSAYRGPALNILIDQGAADQFYREKQLLPEHFASASEGTPVTTKLRLQEGYDHSYYFVSTFIEEHLDHLAHHIKLA
jgi:S-formylglutathione hydrolase